MLNQIERKVLAGERLSPEEGVWLLTDAPLLEVGSLAHELRLRKTDPGVVTYVIDTNPNYTNALHGRLPLLRLLPQAGRERRGRLHARRRRRDAA